MPYPDEIHQHGNVRLYFLTRVYRSRSNWSKIDSDLKREHQGVAYEPRAIGRIDPWISGCMWSHGVALYM